MVCNFDHFQLIDRLLTQLSPNQTLLLVAKDIDAGEDLTNKTRFFNFESSAKCLSSVDQLPAAEKKTFIEDAVKAMSSISGRLDRKVIFLGHLEAKTNWKFSQSPKALELLRELLVKSQDDLRVSKTDIYLAENFPDSVKLSKRFVSTVNSWKSNPKLSSWDDK